MVRQAIRIEKALDSSIKQFYAALHAHLSVSPERSPGLSGVALQTSHPRIDEALQFADCTVIRVRAGNREFVHIRLQIVAIL